VLRENQFVSGQDQKVGRVPVRLQTRFALERAAKAAFPFVVDWSVMPPLPKRRDADAIVRAMSDYVAKLKTVCLAYEAGIEFVADGQQKIQFVSSGQIMIDRPDMFRVSRSAGYADVDFQVEPLPRSPDRLAQDLEGPFSFELPGAELLSEQAYTMLMSNILEVRHFGRISIDGAECEHLAFRGAEVDRQLWVQIGPWPVPRRYVVTSRMIASAPQYSLHIKDWKSGAGAQAGKAAFRPPGDARIDVIAFLGLRGLFAGLLPVPAR
jgi:hypothetical protein